VQPMGSEVRLAGTPRFVVRAAGAFEQLPGCEVTPDGPSAERLARLCRGECNRPGNKRKQITRVEVVRVLPQRSEGEPIAGLVKDPWKTLPCPPGSDGCRVEFDDPEFRTLGRDATYYVRAIEEPSLAINAGGLRCEKNPDGSCKKAHPCYGDYRTAHDDDCLASNEERAWSSPIFVRLAGAEQQ